MNLKPNFEQYKRDQEKLEKIPTIKSDFHFVLNDISKKIINNEELTKKEINDLEMVYDMTQDLEKDLINAIDRYRSQAIVTKAEFLLTSDYFLTANQNGPESNKIKDNFIKKNIMIEDFSNLLIEISIPEYTREILKIVYVKMIESNI